MAAGQWQDTEATSSELTLGDQQGGQTRFPAHEAAPEAESMSSHNSDAEGELSHPTAVPSDTAKRKKRKRRKKKSDDFDTEDPAAAANIDVNLVEAPAKQRKNRKPRRKTPTVRLKPAKLECRRSRPDT